MFHFKVTGIFFMQLVQSKDAKSNDILLAGNNKFTLNGSYSISNQGLFENQWDFVNITKFSNLLSKEFPDSNLQKHFFEL